ncbi:MAG: Rieske (2Fe-2S) protein [Candidatus Dormibacteraceae bacterium]
MTEREEERAARRLEGIVRRLQRGQRPEIEPGDAPDAEAIRTASRLAGAREAFPRMDREFRRKLATQLGPPGQPALPSRRWALAAAAGIVGGAALGVAGDRLAGALEPAPTQTEITPEHQGATWIDTGYALTDLTEGTPVHVTAGGLPLFLVRAGDEVRALSSICSHKPCQLLWDAAEGRIRCPWGTYQMFSLEGSSNRSEIPPLPFAKLRVRAGRIEIYGVS